MNRFLQPSVEQELLDLKKMLFISGPRQVGKTTLLEKLASSFEAKIYNWDNLEHRKLLTRTP